MTLLRRTALIATLLCSVAPRSLAEPRVFTVSPGQSIQSAIDKAIAGDTVQVLPGEYAESLSIHQKNLTLRGLFYEGLRATLVPADHDTAGIRVDGNGVRVEGFIVEDFGLAGIVVENARDTVLHDLIVRGSPDGIRAENTQALRISGCTLSGASHAGVRLSRTLETRIAGCEVFHASIGILSTDAQQTEVDNLSAHHNGIGIVITGTPDAATPADFCRISNSRIWGNAATSDTPDGTFVTGVGIAIAAADHTEVARCWFAGNSTYAVVVSRGPDVSEDAEPASPGVSDHTYVHHNRYERNGGDPDRALKSLDPEAPGGDLYWDGTGERNQFQESLELKTYPENLVVERGGVHTEVIHFM